MLVSLDGDANSLVDAVLGVNVDVAGAFLFGLDHTFATHGCNLRVAALVLDILMPCNRFVFEYLLCFDRKGLSDCQRNRALVDLHRLGISVFATGRGRMHYLRFCQPYLFAVYQLVGFDEILIVSAAL